MKIKATMGKIQPLGVSAEGAGIQFAFVSSVEDCGVILYDTESEQEICRLPFPEEYRIGNVHTMTVQGLDRKVFLYAFYEGEKVVCDPYARQFSGNRKYGDRKGLENKKACFRQSFYDWKGDQNPCIPYDRALVYCMHVRGFTAHASSKVKHRGTFAGVIEKIPYLKDLGVTTLEFQPIYEFDELEHVQREEDKYAPMEKMGEAEPKLNYWGYTRGYYYSPKSSYATSKDSVSELKDLIRALHQNGMEAVPQFYFPVEVSQWEVLDILRFWVTEYHVDGFHIKGQCAPLELICQDPCLARTKIWYYDFPEHSAGKMSYHKPMQEQRRLGIYRDDFCYTVRRFLKGDEGMVNGVLELMRSQPGHAGRINYLTNYEGFTLMDLVSYDRKHNEENGEDNKDGNDYNCSWNCGAEGKSRKKGVLALRKKQIRNALCLLMLSQGTPLLFMGDEFGNSQGGNNNPYCQDNEITWLNWKDLDKNRELFSFVKSLTELRREHPILHKDEQLRLMDYISCGCPDLSYHGEAPWRPNTELYSRQVGIMLCGQYAKIDRIKSDDSFYIGINMHWEEHKFSLPKLPRGMAWNLVLCTEQEKKPGLAEDGNVVTLAPRSICLFGSCKEGEKETS